MFALETNVADVDAPTEEVVPVVVEVPPATDNVAIVGRKEVEENKIVPKSFVPDAEKEWQFFGLFGSFSGRSFCVHPLRIQ